MKTIPPKRTGVRALATTWIVAAGVVLLAELGVRATGPEPYVPRAEQLLDYQLEKLARLPPDAVVLLGDSSVGMDVDAARLAAELGVPALNVALSAGFTTIGDAYLLEQALRGGRRPRAVVLFHSPETWPRANMDEYLRLLRGKLGGASIEGLAYRCSRALALERVARQMRLRVFAPVRGLVYRPDGAAYELEQFRSMRAEFAQYDYAPPAPSDPAVRWAKLEARLAAGGTPPVLSPGGRFEIDAGVQAWFDRTLDLAADAGVPVFVAVAPLWDRMCFHAPNRAFLRALFPWLEAQSRGGTRFRLLWHGALVAPSAWMGDKHDHLRSAARAGPFTDWFATRLRAALAGDDAGAPSAEFFDPFADAPVEPPP